jgi:ubiquinone/menaquinone biosynthesis C-methylase UbiE
MQSTEELVPPQHLLPDYARSRSYTAAGTRFLDTAVSRGLQPHHRVLDLGCGVGRFAVALAGYLDERGSYVGIDIHKRSIRICRTYVGRKLDNFKFKHVRPVEAAEFRFPCRTASFDFVFSNSLFTHLLPEVAANYLLEIGRVLRPGGRTLNTLFLINPESLAQLDSGTSPQGTTHVFGDGLARVKRIDRPQGWVAHDEDFVRELHERAHLQIEQPIRYGAWPGRESSGPGFGEKDIVVAVRARRGIRHLFVRGTSAS